MVERAISLLAAIPATLVHALNFFVASSGTLVLLCAGDGNERVDGGKRVAALGDALVQDLKECAHVQTRAETRRLTGGGRGMWCATIAGGAPPEVEGE